MKTCIRKVAPMPNRCVVFSTEADTWHGHPDPRAIPGGMTRRSMALYYYSASRSIYSETPKRTTTYVARPHDSAQDRAEARRFRTGVYLKEWLPAMACRGIARVGRMFRRMASSAA